MLISHLLSSHKSQPIDTKFKVADGKPSSQVCEAQSVLANIPTADENSDNEAQLASCGVRIYVPCQCVVYVSDMHTLCLQSVYTQIDATNIFRS